MRTLGCLKEGEQLYYKSQLLKHTEFGLSPLRIQLVKVINDFIGIYGDSHVEHTNGMCGGKM
jgi:hypothetical protein